MARFPVDIGIPSGGGISQSVGGALGSAVIPVGKLRPFGYGRLIDRFPKEFGLRGRLGPRPLLVVLTRPPGSPPFAHSEIYYDDFFFNAAVPDSFAFIMNSYGAAPTRVFPWPPVLFNLGDADAQLDMPSRAAEMIRKIVRLGGDYRIEPIDNASLDDNVITSGEMFMTIVDTYSSVEAATCYFSVDAYGLKVDARASFIGHRSTLMTHCHEFFHQWGAVDLYDGNDPSKNRYLTPMADTQPGGPDARWSVELDPWHRMQFGVTAPVLVDFGTLHSGSVDIPSVARDREGSAVLFYDSQQGKTDYFMVELREPIPGTVDRSVPPGIAVWVVHTDDNGDAQSPGPGIPGVAAIGRQLTPGSTGLWANGDQTPVLAWSTGSWSGLSLAFSETQPGMATISWSTNAVRPPPHDVPRNVYFRSPVLPDLVGNRPGP